MIDDHCLKVRPWEPIFNARNATIDKVAWWFRVPKVFLEYFDDEALTFIGNRIGQTIKVNIHMAWQLRGHIARICVLVDFGKQLMFGFHLYGEDYYLEYKGLHMLCTNCRIYGHQLETSPSKKSQVNLENRTEQANATRGQVPQNAKQSDAIKLDCGKLFKKRGGKEKRKTRDLNLLVRILPAHMLGCLPMVM
ncbi:uncharacterized protein LOC129309012 [Prosopis cineraria]|uniref:uncharacterized protein LOC129309012 n=1 Tax=Prosopis cineraria TaxID=364024 RepID=UPI002410AA1E|nr:uncharacterized protein LOC129309012 [Prosopis cineraria]